MKNSVDVNWFIEHFSVDNLKVQDTLHEHPVLCYLLGKVTDQSQGEDNRPDGAMRPVYFLTEGSGMFGLVKPDDASRWKGIFNHSLGTARQVGYLGQRLLDMSASQIRQFTDDGFETESLARLDSVALRDFMMVSHAGRRQMDEYNWHGLRDEVHRSGDSGTNTETLMKRYDSPPEFLDWIGVEKHGVLIPRAKGNNYLPSLTDNLLTYPDWTFGQAPVSLAARFEGLRKSQRESEEVLDTLEGFGKAFEQSLIRSLGQEVLEQMSHVGANTWETEIRRAYCLPSGIQLSATFPNYPVKE